VTGAFAGPLHGYAADVAIEDESDQPDTTSEQPDDDTVETAAGPDQDAEPPGEDGQSAGTADRPPSDS
jgi:hypothetical protein